MRTTGQHCAGPVTCKLKKNLPKRLPYSKSISLTRITPILVCFLVLQISSSIGSSPPATRSKR